MCSYTLFVFPFTELEFHATGRNIAEGPASVLKGLSTVVAYATNGSLIALTQRIKTTKLQVVFIERNGLRHGEFDLRLPDASLCSSTTLTTTASAGGGSTGGASTGGLIHDTGGRWEVQSLYWDMPSTLLAVGLVWIPSVMTGRNYRLYRLVHSFLYGSINHNTPSCFTTHPFVLFGQHRTFLNSVTNTPS